MTVADDLTCMEGVLENLNMQVTLFPCIQPVKTGMRIDTAFRVALQIGTH
jgi:hypothetical protein